MPNKETSIITIIMVIIVVFLLPACVEQKSDKIIFTPCEIGEVRQCDIGSSVGACQKPLKTCLSRNIWTTCFNEIKPTTEICDGLDNDCDGETDEYVKNVCGMCGEVPDEICDGEDNDCDGEIDERFDTLPELCDGIDNDCDSLIDEGLTKRKDCQPAGAGDWIVYDTEPNSLSTCTVGWKECRAGNWSECFGWRGPEPEICDGWDNDCNGFVDEIEFNEIQCGLTDEGTCEYGIEICVAGEMACFDTVVPQSEICDALDNNCNGLTDEDLERQCENVCGIGVEFCNNGVWRGCTAMAPTAEVCDGVDNDCDGQIDEGLECECLAGDQQFCPNLPCGWGIKVCLPNGIWSLCQGNLPQPEMCNNHDDNCNNQIDEGLVLECFEEDIELVGVGICEAGQTTCEAGIWGPCEDQVLPELESCDGIDNDCDGATDNLERYFEKVDLIFAVDISGSMDPYIRAIVSGVSNYISSLQGTDHKFGLVLFGSGYLPHNDGAPFLITQLTTVEQFISDMSTILAFGATEPSIDTVYHLGNPQNALQVAWRSDATPIIIMIGDEDPQTQLGLTLGDLTDQTEVCILPGCQNATNENWLDGDPLELFVFCESPFIDFWNQATFAEGQRVFNIRRILQEELLAIDLALIFREICVEP